MTEKAVSTDSQESADAEVATRGGRPRDPSLDDAIIQATRRRLVVDGYSRMTLGDIASDAGVTRPTLYRRWPGKFELVVDALDFGFRAQRATYPNLELAKLRPFEAFTEAIRRVDPCYFNPDAMILMGNFMGEAFRTPELLEIVREHAVEPRVDLVERVLNDLRSRGEVREDIDTHTLATICFGSYYAAFLRGDSDRENLAEKVAATLWPGIAAV